MTTGNQLMPNPCPIIFFKQALQPHATIYIQELKAFRTKYWCSLRRTYECYSTKWKVLKVKQKLLLCQGLISHHTFGNIDLKRNSLTQIRISKSMYFLFIRENVSSKQPNISVGFFFVCFFFFERLVRIIVSLLNFTYKCY